MKIAKVKGTYDVLPNESKKWLALEEKVKEIFTLYNYKEIRTPIMEYSEVFHRKTEFSDMVTKETYNFVDKGNRNITLRPESTACIVRSYVENKLYVDSNLLKVYYIGPNFRYERPQKGRYRQFMQFGVEAIGEKSASLDAEVITIAYEIINSLGLKNVKVKINSLGDATSRTNYQDKLKTYYAKYYDKLSDDSKERMTKNPLRILDSKDESDKLINKSAPLSIDNLNETSKKYFDEVISYLDKSEIKYEISNYLVRGIDYYSDVVFEIDATIEGFGAQNTLGGGGRYQNLVKELGGPDIEGVGFAFGMERLLYALESENIELCDEDSLDVFIVAFDNETRKIAGNIMRDLRSNKLKVDSSLSDKNIKSQVKQAITNKSKYIVFIGEEFKSGLVSVKNTKTEEQIEIKSSDLTKYLLERIKR